MAHIMAQDMVPDMALDTKKEGIDVIERADHQVHPHLHLQALLHQALQDRVKEEE